MIRFTCCFFWNPAFAPMASPVASHSSTKEKYSTKQHEFMLMHPMFGVCKQPDCDNKNPT